VPDTPLKIRTVQLDRQGKMMLWTGKVLRKLRNDLPARQGRGWLQGSPAAEVVQPDYLLVLQPDSQTPQG
jgi:hypothetical protein